MYTIVDLCLICLQNNDKNLKSILSKDGDGVLLEEKLRFFLFELVDLKSENSVHICLSCLEKLDHVYKFKQKCLQNITKFNSYVQALQSTENLCGELQISLIDVKYLKEKIVKCEDDANSEPIKLENFNVDNITVKKEYSDDYTVTDYLLQSTNIQEIEAKHNVVKEEHENIVDNDDKIQENNVFNEQEIIDMFINDELEYEFIGNIVKNDPENNDDNNIQSNSFDDSKSKHTQEINEDALKDHDYVVHYETREENITTETEQIDDVVEYELVDEIVKDEPERADVEVNLKSELNTDPKDTLQNDSTNTAACSARNSVKYIECYKTFKQSYDYNSHTGEKPYECDFCDLIFACEYHLMEHKRTHHKTHPKKNLECDICKKLFTHKCYLTQHRRSHTGEKPFKCDICGNGFNQSSNLISHRRVHTGEKPYKCDVCYKSFSHSNSLVKHKRLHTGERPFECEICGKTFANPTNFASHKRSHTGEKPYECDICGKSYVTSRYLVNHKRKHARKTP